MVRQHVQAAVDAILELAPESMAIYLSGGFGRGEGTVRRTAAGWIPVNDYDLVVVSPAGSRLPAEAAGLGRRLAGCFGADYVDIGWWTTETLRTAWPTLENYDFRQVARLLHGVELRAEMPAFVATQIPRFEYARLICNRAAGLNTTRLPVHAGNADYAFSQGLKAWQAVGDVMVSMIEGYSPRMTERMAAFRRICSGPDRPGWLRDQESSRVLKAYTLKLRGWTQEEMADMDISGAATALGDVFRWLVAGEGRSADGSLHGALNEARRLYGARSAAPWRNLGRAMKRMHPGYAAGDMAWLGLHVLLAQLAVAVAVGRGGAAERREYLRQFWWVPGAWRQSFDAAGAALLWESFNHG